MVDKKVTSLSVGDIKLELHPDAFNIPSEKGKELIEADKKKSRKVELVDPFSEEQLGSADDEEVLFDAVS